MGAEPSAAPLARRGRTISAAAIVAVLLLPFVPLVLLSVSRGYFHPQVLPAEWSLRAWARVLAPGSAAWPALADTLVVALAVAAASLLVGVPAGRVLGVHRFRGRRVVELALLAPALVPTIAVAIGIHVVMIRLGLDGGRLGVVLAHLVPATPYVVLLTAGVFANADLELEAQARSLGASRWQAWWHVTRPLVAPGIAVATLFGFLVSWGQYALTLVIGGGQVVTLPILVFASASGGDDAVTAATALFHGLPAAVALLLVARVLHLGGPVPVGVR